MCLRETSDTCTGGPHMHLLCLTVAGLTFPIVYTVNNSTAHSCFLNILKSQCTFWKLLKFLLSFHILQTQRMFLFFFKWYTKSLMNSLLKVVCALVCGFYSPFCMWSWSFLVFISCQILETMKMCNAAPSSS